MLSNKYTKQLNLLLMSLRMLPTEVWTVAIPATVSKIYGTEKGEMLRKLFERPEFAQYLPLVRDMINDPEVRTDFLKLFDEAVNLSDRFAQFFMTRIKPKIKPTEPQEAPRSDEDILRAIDATIGDTITRTLVQNHSVFSQILAHPIAPTNSTPNLEAFEKVRYDRSFFYRADKLVYQNAGERETTEQYMLSIQICVNGKLPDRPILMSVLDKLPAHIAYMLKVGNPYSVQPYDIGNDCIMNVKLIRVI